MNRKEIRHQLAQMEQDRIFIRNAHIRQKIYAGSFAIVLIAFWAWCMSFDCVNVWWGVLFVPVILFSLWIILTSRNYVWDSYIEEEGGE